jgi:hypothetical protein
MPAEIPEKRKPLTLKSSGFISNPYPPHPSPLPPESVPQWQNAEKCHADLVSASNKIK